MVVIMEVINDLLNYNNLKIVQNTDWFSFSLDSVLLADFVKVKDEMKIIDFCTGNAPIPLFLSTRIKSQIIGIEIQKPVYELAKKSVEINDLSKQILIINDDVKNISKRYDTDSVDLITCNPPYFKVNDKTQRNKNSVKAIARHELELNLNDIFKAAKKMLKNNGSIAMVHRTDRLTDVINEMRNNNIEPKRLKFIYPKENANSNMFLIEGKKNGNVGLKVEKSIIVHNSNGSYTKEIIEIFNGGNSNEDKISSRSW